MFVYDSYAPFRKGAVANIVPREKALFGEQFGK